MTTFKKSWTAYIWPILWVAIWCFLLSRYWSNWGQIRQYLFGESDPQAMDFWIASAGVVIVGFLAIRTILHLFWLTTFKIDVEETGVHVRHGIFPWNKFERTWDSAQIFNCLYQGTGFSNWFFRKGHLILQGSEGATHQFIFTEIGGVRKACGLVNEIRTGGR